MKFELYQPLAIHELGKRDNQEDSVYPLLGKATKADRLYIVCDGMGGHEHGEVASQTFIHGLSSFFNERVSPSEVLSDDTLRDAIEHAYQELDRKDDGAFKKMGTTLTLLYMHRSGVTCAHIGDSRIYHIRPGKGLLYVSRDHSLVFDLYQNGEISYDDMKTSPQKNIITRAVQPGVDNRVRADIIHITDIQPGDYFYLCSDGMLEQMENGDLLALFSSDASDEKKQQKLIAETVDNNDNHSAYILHVESVTREAGDEGLVNEEPTARCNALNIIPIAAESAICESAPEDVEVVSTPIATHKPSRQQVPYIPKKKRSLWPFFFIVAVLLIGGFVAYNFIGNDNEQDEKEKEGVSIDEGPAPIERVTSTAIPKVEKEHQGTVQVQSQNTHAVSSKKQKKENQQSSQTTSSSQVRTSPQGAPPAATLESTTAGVSSLRNDEKNNSIDAESREGSNSTISSPSYKFDPQGSGRIFRKQDKKKGTPITNSSDDV